MNPEILHPQNISSKSTVSAAAPSGLDEAIIKKLDALRQQMLQNVKGEISRKSYFALEEKLLAEQQQLKDILAWQQGKLQHLANYSFILDSHYFEQEFLNLY